MSTGIILRYTGGPWLARISLARIFKHRPFLGAVLRISLPRSFTIELVH